MHHHSNATYIYLRAGIFSCRQSFLKGTGYIECLALAFICLVLDVHVDHPQPTFTRFFQTSQAATDARGHFVDVC